MKASTIILVLFFMSLMASTPTIYQATNEVDTGQINDEYKPSFIDTINALKDEREMAAFKTREKQKKITLILNKLEDEKDNNDSPIPMPAHNAIMSNRQEVSNSLRPKVSTQN